MINGEDSITYKELWEESDKLANYIKEHCREDKTPVIVYGHKNPKMLVAFLACVKSGRAYVPVDTSVPRDRVEKIIDSVEPGLILVSEPVERYKDYDFLNVISDDYVSNVNESVTKDDYVQDDSVYYIIFTSGSTGTPKGVQITYSALNHFTEWALTSSALTETHPSYTYNCPDMLTDGLRGAGPYNSGDFAGWYNKPVEVVIEMDGTPYSSVTLSTFVFRYDYVFNPLDLTVYVSEDGKDYSQVAHDEYPVEGGVDDGNGCNEYTVTFPETSARYLKVTAACLEALPEWHSGKGNPGFVFVDEIIVL